jgi:hypothetical protein
VHPALLPARSRPNRGQPLSPRRAVGQVVHPKNLGAPSMTALSSCVGSEFPRHAATFAQFLRDVIGITSLPPASRYDGPKVETESTAAGLCLPKFHK